MKREISVSISEKYPCSWMRGDKIFSASEKIEIEDDGSPEKYVEEYRKAFNRVSMMVKNAALVAKSNKEIVVCLGGDTNGSGQ